MALNVRKLVITALGIAFVAVLVFAVRVPIPATGGFTHPGAVAEIFVALAFGPLVGALAAGLGAAIADLLAGYASFAPLTLLAHGALGLIAGSLGWRRGMASMLAGWVLGGLALVVVYFTGEATIYGFGTQAALAEVPINLIQVGLGLLGLLLFQQVRRAYPPIETMADEQSFEELDSP